MFKSSYAGTDGRQALDNPAAPAFRNGCGIHPGLEINGFPRRSGDPGKIARRKKRAVRRLQTLLCRDLPCFVADIKSHPLLCDKFLNYL